jgi:hypothetical protein
VNNLRPRRGCPAISGNLVQVAKAYCKQDKQLMFSETDLAGTISNDWPQNHDYYSRFGRNLRTPLRRSS